MLPSSRTRARRQRNPLQGRSDLRGFFLFGWIVIAVVFGGLGAWSVFAPFEGAVLASGNITVEDQNKAVQHLEGGIVSEIHATEGAAVQSGDLLIRLDGTAIRAELASIDAQLVDLVAREARLKAERDGEDTITPRPAIDFLMDTDELADALASQQTLLDSRADARETQVSILDQRISQLRRRIEGLRAEVASKSEQADIIEEELVGVQSLVDDGLAPKPQLLSLQRARAELNGVSNSLDADIAATEVSIGEAELQKLYFSRGFREEVVADLSKVQTQLATLLQQRTSTADRLDRLEIVSPRSGYVLGARAHTVGGVIGSGEPIMYIVPRDDQLVASVQVLPQDIDKIEMGQAARLRFSAFSQNETPEVAGKVAKVSADAFVDDQTGLSYYTVVVELPSQNPLGDAFEVVPGMPVEAMLQTESRNALSYLTKPLTDSVSRAFRE